MVYVLWSTTYLAMRIGVSSTNAFPPFFFAMLRMPAAAVILLAIGRLRGLKMKPNRSELLRLALSGNLLWVGGHSTILWAEQYASSGFSCLMASSAPIWVAIIELLLYRRRPSVSLIVPLLVGFAGIGLLSGSSFGAKGATNFLVMPALIVGPLCWALGSVYQARRPINLAPHVLSGYQHLMAFFGLLIVSSLLGERVHHPGLSAWMAWGYLVVFGSVIAFTSFMTALRLLPLSIAMTYAYVNPVLALFLGWLMLGEPITAQTLAGAGLVILGVFGIFRVKQGRKGP
jgi:drug/metabolite transporter (DMT)-like permease